MYLSNSSNLATMRVAHCTSFSKFWAVGSKVHWLPYKVTWNFLLLPWTCLGGMWTKEGVQCANVCDMVLTFGLFSMTLQESCIWNGFRLNGFHGHPDRHAIVLPSPPWQQAISCSTIYISSTLAVTSTSMEDSSITWLVSCCLNSPKTIWHICGAGCSIGTSSSESHTNTTTSIGWPCLSEKKYTPKIEG